MEELANVIAKQNQVLVELLKQQSAQISPASGCQNCDAISQELESYKFALEQAVTFI